MKRLIFFLFVIFLAGVALLPTLLNTGWGTRQITAWVNQHIPGQLEVGALHLRWGCGQRIERAILRDPEGAPVVEIGSLDLAAPLWSIALGGLDSSRTELKEVVANIVVDQTGASNLEQSLGRKIPLPNGPLHAHISFEGQIDHRIFRLMAPLTVHFEVTPLTVAAWLKGKTALFDEVISSDQPAELIIQPSGFQCPVYPFHLDELVIGDGLLALGRVKFQSGGELGQLLQFIKSLPEPTFSIWFTPLYFSLQGGQFQVKRVDMLVGGLYTLAFWGEFHLVQNRGDFTLGLTAQTLRDIFRVPLSQTHSEMMLQLPLKLDRGRARRLDAPQALANIALLAAQMKGSARFPIVGQFLDSREDVRLQPPPPTTTPLPWGDVSPPLQSVTDPPKEKKHRNKWKSLKRLFS